LTFSDFLNLFVLSEKYDLGLLLRALQSRGLFQSLAEPNLVAESGKEASFLAGGEFPIPLRRVQGRTSASPSSSRSLA
jgi:pilus assembly protein CpaC